MSDLNSGLPIRTEADGADQRVHVKIVDGTNPSVNQATVDSDKNVHVEIHGNDPLGVDRVVRTSEAGALTPDGVYHATNNTKPGNSGIVASTRSASPDDTTQIQRITSVTNATKRLLDVSMHDENGDAFSPANPLPVTWVDSEGVEINDFATATVAAGGISNHDYTVTTGKTFKLTQLWSSASGKMKIELQIESAAGSGTFATKFVGFNSTANPNIPMPMSEHITVAAGVRVRVIRTNKDLQPQDVYTTISGHEI